jgi:HD superfamily phosphodiesterase
MIDIQKARIAFKEYINNYDNQDDPGFNLKVVHTYHVVDNAIMISKKLGLSEEDINLAALIAILHDIGRFDELKNLKKFDSVGNDHAMFASKLLFEEGLITKFIDTDEYNNIIKKAVENHNKKQIEEGLSDKELLHAKIIRDADKLDNYRVKQEERIENIFPGVVNSKEELENSLISDNVYNSVMKEECVDIKDRKYPLDYWICVLAFTFDFYFKESLLIVKENKYIDILIDRFNYINSKEKMNIIRKVINDYVEKSLNY